MQTTDTVKPLTRAMQTLLEIRHSAAMDLATMPSSKQGTPWALDRIRDIEFCNRQLARLGYFPPHVKA